MSTTVKQKTLRGTVIKSSMKDTAVVEVSRFVKHTKYQKYTKINKKFLAHDPMNVTPIGAVVEIVSTRPISKRKSFKIVTKD